MQKKKMHASSDYKAEPNTDSKEIQKSKDNATVLPKLQTIKKSNYTDKKEQEKTKQKLYKK